MANHAFAFCDAVPARSVLQQDEMWHVALASHLELQNDLAAKFQSRIRHTLRDSDPTVLFAMQWILHRSVLYKSVWDVVPW